MYKCYNERWKHSYSLNQLDVKLPAEGATASIQLQQPQFSTPHVIHGAWKKEVLFCF